ncbi:PREDICTED: somatomedin-B and thrombospondin type-1 domain-containing protein [Bison bison bison]|uniref:Somatomedin-B and thrombospondin type-1 domain-containing protein n=1 Tax=Bison bison bison TaxID=43346 RepID=A0A6P3HRP6_BISBB|nr:PREDICTED: somatomedin-B and thrombospondin type-1 domain-containing protein [Bison bison bison]
MLQKERTFLQSYLSSQWPGEVAEGNWVSWEKYIVAFWAKSGRAVRLSPVRAHRVRYGSWLRSQAADWLTCPQKSGSRVWSQEMWPPWRGGWRARSLPEIPEHLLFRCLPAVPAGRAMGAVGRGPGSRASIEGAGGGGALPAGPRPAPDGRAARAGVGRGPARGRAGPGCSGAGALRGTPALAPKDALPANAAGSSLSEMTLHVNEKARPCIVGEWSPWSGCASQCRPTARVRRRAVQQEPQNGGEPCPALEERAGCLEYATPQGEDCGHAFVPAFITTSAFNKERTRQAASPHWTTRTEDAGYCMEFKTESLTHHCALENRPLTRWMQYLREGYTVCVDCQPPAMNSVSLRCSGDGLDSDGNQTLHWQAIGNPRCQGTWKKVRRVEQCSCPAVHSFIFI